MRKDETTRNHRPIDPTLVAEVTRQVIARLSRSTPTNANPPLADRIITAQTIESIPGTPKQILVKDTAVITPAARDAATRRGIAVQRVDDGQRTTGTNHDPRIEITDTTDPRRANSLLAQLARRAITGGSARIVLSDQPAGQVHQLCTAGERAVMISNVNDVRRFAEEFGPTVWVLDMKRMNFASAVNAAAQIIRNGNHTR